MVFRNLQHHSRCYGHGTASARTLHAESILEEEGLCYVHVLSRNLVSPSYP